MVIIFLKSLFASSVSLFIWMLGGFDFAIICFLGLMSLDFISGLIVGFSRKNLNSKRAYRGLFKKFMILILISTASIMERIIPNTGIRTFIIVFYSSVEILSIIENAGKCGVKIPHKWRKALEQLQEEENNEK